MHSGSLPIYYLGSYTSVRLCPELNLAEYCFIGRSNVGKSSMINALTGQSEIARTSKKPGKTQSINLFIIRENPEWIIADLPGYGFAQVSKTTRQAWSKLIDEYLLHRPHLICTFLLIDIRHPMQENDRQFMRQLGENGIPFCILFTKSDKLKPAELEKAVAEYQNAILTEWEVLPPHFVTSSMQGKGMEEVLRYIRQLNTIFTDQANRSE